MTARAMFAAGRGTLVLDAGSGFLVSAADGVAPYDSSVGIRFNTDGTVETGTELNGGGISWSSAGEWIDPNFQADSIYSVRFTNFNGAGGGDWTVEAAADDIWIGLGSQRVWTFTKTDFGTESFSVDWEVRKTAGAPPATASQSQTFTCENTA